MMTKIFLQCSSKGGGRKSRTRRARYHRAAPYDPIDGDASSEDIEEAAEASQGGRDPARDPTSRTYWTTYATALMSKALETKRKALS